MSLSFCFVLTINKKHRKAAAAKRKAVYPPAYFFRVRTRDLLVQKYASANWSKPAFIGLPTPLTIRSINSILSPPPHLPPRRTTTRIRLHPNPNSRGLCPHTPGPRRTGSDCSAYHHVNQTNLTHAVPAVQIPRLPCAPPAMRPGCHAPHQPDQLPRWTVFCLALVRVLFLFYINALVFFVFVVV